MKKLILQQDDCAPDSRRYFDKEMERTVGLTINDFKKASHVSKANEMEYRYFWMDYMLVYRGDDPYYKLYRIEK